jgi:hypothetical protein
VEKGHRYAAWVRRALLLLAVLGLAGCALLPWARKRPDPFGSVSGPAPYVDDCDSCHDERAEEYADSLHAAKGIRCGQCHTPGTDPDIEEDGHPDPAQPIADGKCGGCHQPQYQQTLATIHYSGRSLEALGADEYRREELREHDFVVGSGDAARFVGDEAAGELGGRLCAACHFDEHRLGRRTVESADACTGCHVGYLEHYPEAIPGFENLCTGCHVRVGVTDAGQVVNTHLFPSLEEQGDAP